MQESTVVATLIRVNETLTDQGRWVATSDDLPGLFVMAADLDSLHKQVPIAIQQLQKATHGVAPIVHALVSATSQADPRQLPKDIVGWAVQPPPT